MLWFLFRKKEILVTFDKKCDKNSVCGDGLVCDGITSKCKKTEKNSCVSDFECSEKLLCNNGLCSRHKSNKSKRVTWSDKNDIRFYNPRV
jgi:hypothetical protein